MLIIWVRISNCYLPVSDSCFLILKVNVTAQFQTLHISSNALINSYNSVLVKQLSTDVF